MEAMKQRHIQSGDEYTHLFPDANTGTHTVRKNAQVSHTVAFIPKVVEQTLGHTIKIAPMLQGRTEYETCRNIWNFVYNHIAYRKDRDGYEQIRSPARTWHDRRAGVDCDCYTTFISSVLTNLNIRHKLRITKYHRDYFQHIYPVALIRGKPVVIDCVTDKFDYEVPYSEKKDYTMDLQYLDGLYDNEYSTDGFGELGKAKKSGTHKKKKLHIDLKKVLNVVNKVNPATVAMRNGVLASMKLNIGNVAKRLRWSYMTHEQAQVKGVDMDKWQQLVKARQKLEKIFYDAGGKTANFKKAILNGKGNKDHAVHGFDGLGSYSATTALAISDLHPHMPLRKLLGNEMYYSENDMGDLGALGEPVTASMIAAASSVITAIAATLHKIGDIFKGKGAGAKDFDEKANNEAEKDIPPAKDGASIDSSNGGGSGDSSDDKSVAKSETDGGSGGSADNKSEDSNGGGDEKGDDKDGGEDDKSDGAGGDKAGKDKNKKDGFWDKNKKWIVPVGIGAAGLSIIAVAMKAAHHPPKPPKKPAAKPMHGTPKGKNHHRSKAHHHKAHHKKVKKVVF